VAPFIAARHRLSHRGGFNVRRYDKHVPKCRFDHRLKQDPRWNVEQLDNGNVRWTTPSGRQHTTEPTRYPI
jgi:hypothetical protein